MKPFLEKTFRQKGTDLGEGLSSRPIVGLQRQAGCHLPHIFHEYPQIVISVPHVSTKLCLPLSFHCSSKLQAACYSLHRLKYPTLHAALSSWHQPPFTCTPPLFPSGHPSVTNSRFEVSSRWPNVVTLRRYAPCPWFHHYNSTVTLKKIDVSSTNWWIHSAHRCGVSPVPNSPKIMPLTWFLWNITI